ncbi:retrovirus-related pol polyprotein from transposon TNT 1-94 [Tanacetum coccineum]
MAKIQEVLPADSGSDVEPLEKVQYDDEYNVFANERQHYEQPHIMEKDNSNGILDSSNMCDNDNQDDKNAEECDDERAALANLIANLTLNTEENKKILKQLKKANASLAQELKNKSRQAYNVMTNNINHFKLICDQAWKKQCVLAEFFPALSKGWGGTTAKDMSHLDEQTELQCLYLDKIKECESLANEISKQKDKVCKDVYIELLRSFAKLEKHSISLELKLQQCQEQMKNDIVCKQNGSTVFLKEREQYHEIQDLKAQLQDKNIAISELKKLIEKCKGKSMETNFDKPFVVRQPNALMIPKPSVLGKPTPFSDSLERKSFSKTKSVSKTNVSEGLSKLVTTQTSPQTARQAVRNINVIKLGMYRIDTRTTQTRAPQLPRTSRNTNPRVSTSSKVIHKTSVSRPQLKSTQLNDKVVQNNSQVKSKKTEVEDQHRISSISNKTKSVTTRNDSLKSSTSNVNAVCATCGKYVFNLNHDACVSKFLNDVNARTKKPKLVPISNVTIKRVYYVEGLNHNLFSVGQVCDADLEKDIVIGLPKLKYVKDQLCSSCEVRKQNKAPSRQRLFQVPKDLNLLHMDLCGPMRVENINGKKYILVITVQTDRGTKFLNNTHNTYFKEEGIEHQTSTPQTPEQNSVVERQNRTLVEAARTMLSASKLPLFFWAEAIATACYSTSSVNKSFSPTDNPQQQDTQPTANVQSTTAPVNPTTISIAKENNIDNKAKIQVDNAHVDENEFYNIFCTPVREEAESCSRYVEPSNMHTFYQPHQSEHR